MKTITPIICTLVLSLVVNMTIYSQNVAITDDDSYTADSSAMLDVKSTTKGFLMPRLTTAQRVGLINPATGLMVYDTDENVFYYYNGTEWLDVSSGGSGNVWTINGLNVHLSDSTNKVGVGTSTPANKFVVKRDGSSGLNEAIFAVVNEYNDTLFAVYPEGTRVYVKDDATKATGNRGGFAVGGFSLSKGTATNEYLRITPDSIRMYVEDDPALKATGSKGGFAVGGFSLSKGITNEYLRVTPDSVRIYIDDTTALKASGNRGGFAVGGFSLSKGADDNEFLRVTTDSVKVSKSLLIPRMTTMERDNLPFVPGEALIIYNLTDDCMQIFKDDVWSNIWCFQCAPNVIIQPFDATICNGEDTSFTVSATGTNLSYQWQKSTDEGITWEDISNGGTNPTYSGASANTLFLTNVPVSHNGYLYRCHITASCVPAANSNVATLNVGGPSINVTSQPEDYQTLANCHASFNIATDAYGNYQWQLSNDGGITWNDITDGGTAPVYSGTTTTDLSLQNVPLSFGNYKFRCVITSSCGVGTNSNAANLTINTVTPVATAATNVSYFSFTANWNPVTDATGYYLDISTDVNFSTFIPGFNNLFVGDVTTYDVSCLTAGITYYYRLRALLECGTGNSNKITVSTLNDAALPATDVSYFSFTANWNAVGSASAYYLDVSTEPDFSSFVPGYNNLNVGDITSYNVYCLAAGTNYYYRIRAQLTSCTSGNSNTITVSTLNNAATTANNILSFSFSANWSSVAGATDYYLDVSTVPDFSSFLPDYNNLNVGNVTTYDVTCLNPDSTYYYRIRAQLTTCVTGNSNTITVSTLNNAATSATDILSFSFSANWVSVAGASAYFLDISTVPDFSVYLPDYNNLNVGNVTTYDVTCLNPNSTYYYRIRAQLTTCVTVNSNTITVTTLNNAAISATDISYFSFSTNWSSVAGATAYFLDVSTVPDFSVYLPDYNNLNVGNVTTYDVICLEQNTTYYYRIRAQFAACSSGNSNIISVTTSNAVNYATNITLVSFTANWYVEFDATGYYLDVSEYSDFSSFVSGYDNLYVGNVTTYNISGLNDSTTYYYRVRASTSCGISENFNIDSLITQFQIGQDLQGGKIFYIDGTGMHGLISATSDQSSGSQWGCKGTAISGADGTAIGSGEQNTIDIEVGCTTLGIAADICANLVLNDFDDWFLPSKDELNQMYINKSTIGGFSYWPYWSSSESNADYAWYQSCNSGLQSSFNKNDYYCVRCVRSF